MVRNTKKKRHLLKSIVRRKEIIFFFADATLLSVVVFHLFAPFNRHTYLFITHRHYWLSTTKITYRNESIDSMLTRNQFLFDFLYFCCSSLSLKGWNSRLAESNLFETYFHVKWQSNCLCSGKLLFAWLFLFKMKRIFMNYEYWMLYAYGFYCEMEMDLNIRGNVKMIF